MVWGRVAAIIALIVGALLLLAAIAKPRLDSERASAPV